MRPLEFADIDIERHAAQVIALQRVEKGILVDDLATGDVDQHAALLHRGKTGLVEQAHRLRRPLAADHDKIAVRQQPVEQTRKSAGDKQKSKLPVRWFRGPCLRAATADSIRLPEQCPIGFVRKESATREVTGMAISSATGLSDAQHSVQLRRAVVASTVGTIIEAYDFLLYVQVAPLVFAKLYFPSSDPLVGTLQAFGIYAVGFISRPVGAALFGHYGDRIGRKVTLIATLLLTGLSTFAVGFVPSYASIGIWGAVILTVVRFIQGVGIGGEWGGATLIAMEWAKTNAHRGFITSWPQWGGPAGLFLANVMVLLFSWVSGDQFLDWGWRVPFWLSIVMVGIGLYIRLGILETPTFTRIIAERRVERAPVIEVLKRHPKLVALTALARTGQQGPFYIFAAFVFTYGTTMLHSSRDLLLAAVMCATALSAVTIPLAGHLSDRFGRKRMYLIGIATIGVFTFVYFALLNTAIPVVIFVAIILSFIPHDMAYGPQAALIAECFPARLRYSGSSLGFHLASIIAGGPAPLIATALLAWTGSGYSVALYVLLSCVISIAATIPLPDYTNRDISEEPVYGPAESAVLAKASPGG
jgi:MFS family permease